MDSVIVTRNSSSRSTPVEKLEKIAIEIFGSDRVFSDESLEKALERAIKDTVRPLSEDSVGILVTGSVVTVGEARSYLRSKFSKG